MKQREFDALRRPEAIRFSGGQFRLAIESFDDACRDAAQGEEPVEDQRPVTPQAPDDFLHRLKPTPEGAGAPRLEELPGPYWGRVSPEPLELLAEQVGPDALEVVLQQLGKPRGLVVRQILRTLEQTPSGLRQRRLVPIPAQLGDLLPAHLVNRHVHVLHDVEAVEHVQGVGNLFRDHVEVRLPHVTAHETNPLADVVGEHVEESSQALLGTFVRHPEQTLDAADLVDEREIRVAPAPLDLVHTDGLDTREIPVGDSPQDSMFYRAKHVLPGRAEGGCRIRPRQPLRPAGQEPAVTRRQMPLAGRPRHSLHHDATGRAIDPPHRVDEEHRHVPERDELESSGRKPVVTRTLLAAARADRPAVRPGLDVHLQKGLLPRDFDQSLLFVDEGLERLDAIENTLEVHPAVAPAKGLSKQPHLLPKSAAGCSFLSLPARQGGASRRRNAAACWPVPRSSGPLQVAETATRRPISRQRSRDSATGGSPRPTHVSWRHATRTRNAEAYSVSVFTHKFC